MSWGITCFALELSLQRCDGFYFHLFLSPTQGLPRMWPFCMPWLLLPARCFSWPTSCWNASFRERQIEPENRALGHCFPLCLSLPSLPPALHSNISWAATCTWLERGTSEAQACRNEKAVLVPKALPSVTLGKWSSSWLIWWNMRKLNKMISWESFLFS